MIASFASLPPMSSSSPEKAPAPSGGFGLPAQPEAPAAKGLNGPDGMQAPLLACAGMGMQGNLPHPDGPSVIRLAGFDLDYHVTRARGENELVGRDYGPSLILVHDSEYDALDNLASKLKDFSGDIVEPGGHVALAAPWGTYSPEDLQAAADESGLTLLVTEVGHTGATVYRPGGDQGEFDRNIIVDDGGVMGRCAGPGSIDFGN